MGVLNPSHQFQHRTVNHLGKKITIFEEQISILDKEFNLAIVCLVSSKIYRFLVSCNLFPYETMVIHIYTLINDMDNFLGHSRPEGALFSDHLQRQ
jgi:hypothetical protein